MSFLYQAHSGLRYLVLLAAVLAAGYLAYGLATRRPHGRAARALTSTFVGLLDLQIILGIVLVASGVFYPALIGHLMMMVLAAVAAHGLSIAGRKSTEARRKHMLPLAGIVVALALILAGIAAIGRGPLESVPGPTGVRQEAAR